MKTFHYLLSSFSKYSPKPQPSLIQPACMATQPIHYINNKPNLISSYLMVPVEDRVVVDEDFLLFNLLLLSLFSKSSQKPPPSPLLFFSSNGSPGLYRTEMLKRNLEGGDPENVKKKKKETGLISRDFFYGNLS